MVGADTRSNQLNYIWLSRIFFVRFQASKEVLDYKNTSIWWASKEMAVEKTLKDYIGKNEKTKIIVKLQKVRVFIF